MTDLSECTAATFAASVAATAKDIMQAMQTYQQCLPGGWMRTDLLTAVQALHDRMLDELFVLERKHKEDAS